MINEQAFVALIDEKSQTFYRVARSILRSEEDCNDALQESVLKAWASRHKLRDDRYFSTWMTRIIIHECRNVQRKQAKYQLKAEVDFGKEESVPDPDLHATIDSLPEKLRLPLVLHYIEGYSLKEIGAMLSLPVTTIRNRLFAARQKLRLDLETEKEAQPYEA